MVYSWDDIIRLPVTRYQCGKPADSTEAWTGKLYEEPLLTQSNARILIGHGVNGIFRFAALPTQVYPVPIMNQDFEFYPGMYHHTDNIVYLGDLSYSLVINGNTVNLADSSRIAETRYAMHFLPVTQTSENNLAISVISCAPVSDSGAAAFRSLPLPGLPGAIYAIVIRNNGTNNAKGILQLNASEKLIGDYEDLKPEIWKYNAAEVRIRRGTLVLTRPEGSCGIHFQGGKASFNGETFFSELGYDIPSGESRTFCTYIVLSKNFNDITPDLYKLIRRDPLDWFAMTLDFWKERLPRIKLSSPAEEGDLSDRALEFYFRCLLDNFNCLQTDAEGNLLAHRQGAPSHGYGTIWGIDLEPTIISASILCPELAERALVFFLENTRPASTYLPQNHSLPILCAPVMIAAFILRQTGDLDMFNRTPGMLDSLIGIMDEFMNYKHCDETLFFTYWSSDGLVGRRYDCGSNLKFFYAFKGLSYILEALGKDGKKYLDIGNGILASIEKTMLIEGPFGTMISGGSNLDEDDEGLFIKDNSFPYYDGEDTSVMLASVYGAWADDWFPWVNYQRFSRSLFCHNYQAETDIRSWFPVDGIAQDGTAVLSSVSGSVSRQEMIYTLKTALGFIDPVTGSSFWWPSGPSDCRRLTRCSQGHGAWAWHYRSRWLGIETDSVNRLLTVDPRGLPDRIRILPAPGFLFEVEYDEPKGICTLTNLNSDSWTVKVGYRKQGCGTEGYHQIQTVNVVPKETVTVKRNSDPALDAQKKDYFSRKDIIAAEAKSFAENGVLFHRRGALWFWFQGQQPPFDLRFVVGNNTSADWSTVLVRLVLPPNCQALPRAQGALIFGDSKARDSEESICVLDSLESGERKCACFSFYMPVLRKVYGSGDPKHRLTKHLDNDAIIEADINEPDLVSLRASLEAIASDGERVTRVLEFKAGYIPKK